MTYFSPAFLQFFQELSTNNSTEWFNANRKAYETEVKKPFAAFVEEMIARIRKYEPEIEIKPADAIMRINKDTRFSKDKTPYNTHVAANISVFGKKDKSYPGFYFQLSPEKISVFGGAYMVEPDKLQKFRKYIATNPEDFKKAYSDKQFKEKFGEIQGDKNKRLPDKFQQAAMHEPLIANKQFFYSADMPAGAVLIDNLPDLLMENYLAGQKVNEFLKAALR